MAKPLESRADLDRLVADANAPLTDPAMNRIVGDADARFELYHQAEEIIVDDAPWVPLWHSNGGSVLIKPFVNDFFLFPMAIPKFRYLYFTE